MFYQLPVELRTKIFLFDRTRKELFDKVIHQIELIPVLDQILSHSNFYGNLKSTKGGFWYKEYFRVFRKVRAEGFYSFTEKETNITRGISWRWYWKNKMVSARKARE